MIACEFLINKKNVFVSLGFLTTFLSACNFEQLDQLLKLDTHHGSVKDKNVIEQYVETPGVFTVSEDGVWDGRQSLGGVWVAHPNV